MPPLSPSAGDPAIRDPEAAGRDGPELPVPLPLPSRRWILPPLVVRTVLALVLCLQANHLKGLDGFRFYDEAADTLHYLQQIENLLSTGSYVVYPDQPLTRAGRMPGYGMTYLPFRLLAAPPTARTLLVCLQVVVSGVSVYYFALTIFLVLRRRSAFFIALCLYGSALFVADWDYRLLTESLAVSSVIFYFYHLVCYHSGRCRWRLLAAGFWFAYLVFLRPFALPLIVGALPFVWPVATAWRQRLLALARDFAILSAIFVVADLAWIVRNYPLFGRIVPLQVTGTAGYNYSPAQLAQFRWLGAIGHDLAPLPQNLAAWYRPRVGFAHDRFVMPAYVLTSRCSLADIERSRALFDVAVYDQRPAVAEPADREATEILDRCRSSFQQERPLQFHLLSRVRLAKAFFIHAGPTLSLPPFRTFMHRPGLLALKLFAVASYWLILVSGAVGLGLTVRRRDPRLWAMVSPFLWVALLFPMVLRAPEVRYMLVGYPALCLLAVLSLDALLRTAQSRRRPAHPA